MKGSYAFKTISIMITAGFAGYIAAQGYQTTSFWLFFAAALATIGIWLQLEGI